MPASRKTTKADKSEPVNNGGFAIIETGGKQYRVTVGDIIKIEKSLLAFRPDALQIKELIEQKSKDRPGQEISIDFSLVNFISRSFADEILKALQALENNGLKITLVGLAEEPGKLLEIVRNSRAKIKMESAAV